MTFVLIGMMASGKSSVGRSLAKRLKLRFVDVDRLIETATGTSISCIFETSGEAEFRYLEKEAIHSLQAGDNVISVGGGAPLDPDNFSRLASLGTVVYLRAQPYTIIERVSKQPEKRPLLTGDVEETVRKLCAEREATYSKAHLIIDVDGKAKSQIIEEIVQRLHV